MSCFRSGGPQISVTAIGYTAGGRWHPVEWRVGDGPVSEDLWHVERSGLFPQLDFYGNRWEFQQSLAEGEGPLKLRWADYWGEWRELAFPDPEGADKVAEHLDRQCKFLADEPVRNGPSITPADIDQSCVEVAELYRQKRREDRPGRPGLYLRPAHSMAYVEHSSLDATGITACNALYRRPDDKVWNIMLCYTETEDGSTTWAGLDASDGLTACVDYLNEWLEENT